MQSNPIQTSLVLNLSSLLAGLESGHICIVHLKREELLMRFEQESWGAVTALSFRTGDTHTHRDNLKMQTRNSH